MEPEIEFTFLDVQFDLLNQAELKYWFGLVAAKHKKQIQVLNFIFCTDEYLLNMNKEHLNHDYYTDIITFPFSDPESTLLAGDLFISIDRVQENAAMAGHSFIDELHRVMIHGVLHLCGFQDETEPQQAEMRNQENVALAMRMF